MWNISNFENGLDKLDLISKKTIASHNSLNSHTRTIDALKTN